MKTICGISALKKGIGKSVVTIGVFDGIHVGHQLVIKKVIQRARKLKAKAVVLTFDPHPLKTLYPKKSPPRIMSLPHKLRVLEELGVDVCVVVKFNKRFASLRPESFVKKILVEKLQVLEILVADNFMFGKNKKGRLNTLRGLGKKYNFLVKHLKPKKISERIVSSSLIRSLISKNQLSLARKLLGRPVSILGTVIRGDARGRIIGYPTANIDPHHEVIPGGGVYAVNIRLQNRSFNGILNIGRCPTFKGEEGVEPTIEAHIFNFGNTIYGKELEILFIKKIRDEKRFRSKEELTRQIKKDENRAKKIL